MSIKLPKVSFKKQKRERGLSGIGNPVPSTDIKFDGSTVGSINAPNWQTKDNKWGLGFSVEKGEHEPKSNCSWKNIFLSARFDSEEDARRFVLNNLGPLTKKYTFHVIED
jgi:hypothetical protein